jgi:SAM-dependent methyltransferase
MTKHVYDESWQIVVSNRLQLTHIQGRKHGDFFKTIRLVDDFILDTPHNQTILDVGCGYNLNKIYYPERQIHGIDITLEADTFGWLEEVDLTQINFQHAIAINSIHFGSDDDVLERIRTIYNALPVGGKFLFTINNLGKSNGFKSLRDYAWDQEFDVEYKYIRTQQHKQEMREQSRQVIEKNARYNSAIQDIAEIQEKIENFIEYDFFHGLLRVIIKKNR